MNDNNAGTEQKVDPNVQLFLSVDKISDNYTSIWMSQSIATNKGDHK